MNDDDLMRVADAVGVNARLTLHPCMRHVLSDTAIALVLEQWTEAKS